MSPEQFAAPSAEQLATHLAGGIDKGYDEGKSDLTPIEVIRARQAIAAAVRPMPSGTLEVQNVRVEHETLTPVKEIRIVGLRLKSFREAYDADHISLSEEEIRQDMFDSAA